MAPRHLDLEHLQVLMAEAGEAELTQPHQAHIIDAFDIVAMGKEAVAPGREGLGAMEAQDPKSNFRHAANQYPFIATSMTVPAPDANAGVPPPAVE